MSNWALHTHGDPLGALEKFLARAWQAAGLEAMLVPAGEKEQPRLLTDPAGLLGSDPFLPLMLVNAARLLPEVLERCKGMRLGLLLRPCELRALRQILKRKAFVPGPLTIFCVDCLGTYPLDDFDWRTDRKGPGASLSEELLHFAPQGGIAAYRYRLACQVCASPAAVDGDINLGLIGLPAVENLLVETGLAGPDWQSLTDGPATPVLVSRRTKAVRTLDERHANRRARLLDEVSASLPSGLDALLDRLAACGECQACMDACPLCSVARPRRSPQGGYERDDILDWLSSCAGCGMCEQTCPDHLPLHVVFAKVREQLDTGQ
ncbi:MAG: 4Fe-4S dicluster domain-containing protein [Chloroflexi bacterium]|nr:4Fe-4S dicluster domain-containing protein [Chloroflexota bacterium]